MRSSCTLVLLLTACLSSATSSAQTALDQKDHSSEKQIEQGKHYRITVQETDDDVLVTTTYWATAIRVNDNEVTLADGEWAQGTGPIKKPSENHLLFRLAKSVDRMFGRKRAVGIGRGTPMGDDTVVLRPSQITAVQPMTDREKRDRKEAHERSRPRPPHVREIEGTEDI